MTEYLTYVIYKLIINIYLQNVSPRVFEIDGFLSDAEVDEIIAEASAISDDSNGMMRSTTGHEGEVSSMRTSDNAWLNSQVKNKILVLM